ncbi:hypothetical protein A7A78_12470 [Aequorivita soesokkakensis]|uniref:DUF3592 domain-containing protein n=1 Tax=Aequorivita soesokkakensis TaxID=1385699 RepID=A0A1A9LE09_9FLAO|nr:DUF3592 domain-containing protein [Aequorivita soesokkakensis]OAD91317.1 hypothetical protein A7A78_12470 [Aequorivita soesokkakensis]
MAIIYILLPLFGALPLFITVIKMRNGQRIINNGTKTEAKVVKIIPWRLSFRTRMDTLILQYYVEGNKEIYHGKASAPPWQYKVGDTLSITYLNDNPNKMTVKGANVYIPILVFTVLIFLFMIFATFQIEELV